MYRKSYTVIKGKAYERPEMRYSAMLRMHLTRKWILPERPHYWNGKPKPYIHNQAKTQYQKQNAALLKIQTGYL